MRENQMKHANQAVQELGEMQLFRSLKAAPEHQKESVMEPTVSVQRRGDDLSLILQGDFNQMSSQQLLQSLRKLVAMSLKCFAADCPVVFTFKTYGKVDLKKATLA
jgi:hypothetical protein